MTRIGYALVSTVDQDLDIQIGKLKAEGCEIVRSEKISGGSREGRVGTGRLYRRKAST